MTNREQKKMRNLLRAWSTRLRTQTGDPARLAQIIAREIEETADDMDRVLLGRVVEAVTL